MVSMALGNYSLKRVWVEGRPVDQVETNKTGNYMQKEASHNHGLYVGPVFLTMSHDVLAGEWPWETRNLFAWTMFNPKGFESFQQHNSQYMAKMLDAPKG